MFPIVNLSMYHYSLLTIPGGAVGLTTPCELVGPQFKSRYRLFINTLLYCKYGFKPYSDLYIWCMKYFFFFSVIINNILLLIPK